MKISLDKKQIKLINDINQIVKKIFNIYTFNHIGMIYDHPDQFATKSGYHYGHSLLIADLHRVITNGDESKVVTFASPVIFSTVKTVKRSNISEVLVEDDKIYFVHGTDKTHFGFVMDKSHKADSLAFASTKYNRFIEDAIDIDETTITELLNNEIIKSQMNGFKFKLSKELLPVLYKTSTAKLLYAESDIDGTFDAQFMSIRDGVETYHSYYGIIMPE